MIRLRLDPTSISPSSLDDLLLTSFNHNYDDDEDEEDSVGGVSRISSEESKRKREIVRVILSGDTASLKPNSGQAVAVWGAPRVERKVNVAKDVVVEEEEEEEEDKFGNLGLRELISDGGATNGVAKRVLHRNWQPRGPLDEKFGLANLQRTHTSSPSIIRAMHSKPLKFHGA
ncbi:hypothetical protein MLD38_016065 [Melastoma candidum]|uniref:Uncharacterized protein n=1 Tax=Melastoma candidum TaxID=119954 RepID=A0ACB9RJD1_9MYRT|nr:hypothetical protein MLD38_016065 [Melastoma candidum]